MIRFTQMPLLQEPALPAEAGNALPTAAVAQVEIEWTHLTDAELCRRYAVEHSRLAFEALMQRHTGLVLAVCRSVLKQAADADDAFQAVWLLVARKAATLRWGGAFPAWLHRVSVRVCWRALKRRREQTLSGAMWEKIPQAMDELSHCEMGWRLHQELDRLPHVYREALLLHYFDGVSRQEAAQRVGISDSAMQGRLRRARQQLFRRLATTGLTVGAASFALEKGAGLMAQELSVAATQSTVNLAVSHGQQLSAWGSPFLSPGSAPAFQLAQGVWSSMLLANAKWVGVGLLAAMVTCSGATMVLVADAEEGAADKAPGQPLAATAPADGGEATGSITIEPTKTLTGDTLRLAAGTGLSIEVKTPEGGSAGVASDVGPGSATSGARLGGGFAAVKEADTGEGSGSPATGSMSADAGGAVAGGHAIKARTTPSADANDRWDASFIYSRVQREQDAQLKSKLLEVLELLDRRSSVGGPSETEVANGPEGSLGEGDSSSRVTKSEIAFWDARVQKDDPEMAARGAAPEFEYHVSPTTGRRTLHFRHAPEIGPEERVAIISGGAGLGMAPPTEQELVKAGGAMTIEQLSAMRKANQAQDFKTVTDTERDAKARAEQQYTALAIAREKEDLELKYRSELFEREKDLQLARLELEWHQKMTSREMEFMRKQLDELSKENSLLKADLQKLQAAERTPYVPSPTVPAGSTSR